MDAGRALTTHHRSSGIHFTKCIWRTQGLKKKASILFVSVGRHWGLQRHGSTNLRQMARRHWGEYSDILMTKSLSLANSGQLPCRGSWTWWRQQIKWEPPSRTSENWQCAPQCTSRKNCGAISSCSCPSSSFELVANQLFCGSCWYIPHICRNGQWWMCTNAPQILEFTKSLCSCNYTQRGWDRHKSHSWTNDSNTPVMEQSGLGLSRSSLSNCWTMIGLISNVLDLDWAGLDRFGPVHSGWISPNTLGATTRLSHQIDSS